MTRAGPQSGARPLERPCPNCGKPVPLGPEATFRPFCSERCRAIDLGAWLSETYRIPSVDPDGPEAADDDPPKPG